MQIETREQYEGYNYIVSIEDMGYRCGYVQIPEGHYLYEKGYSEALESPSVDILMDAEIGRRGIVPIFCWDGETMTMDILFDVHGGITFSGELPGETGYWIGFYCAHDGDASAPWLATREYKSLPVWSAISVWPAIGGIVRSEGYVMAECKSLINQIIEYYDQEEI